MAGRLAAAGLEPGDRIVTSAETSAELVVTHVAALRLGLVVVPVNTAYREREIAHIVRDARPSAAVVDNRERGEWISHAAAPARVLVVAPDVELTDGQLPALDACAPQDGAMLCYTSGTTGTPKGALLTHRNVLASPAALQLAWRWEPDDRLVLALPLFHMHGLGVGLHGTLLSGASVVLQPRFDPGAVLDAAQAERATLFFGVPTMYDRLARSGRVRELSALRLCVSGSAPLPADVHQRIASEGGVTVLERYGLTETLMNSSNPYDGERRAGTVGFALPGVEIRLGAGDEILVRGPNVFGGYWGLARRVRGPPRCRRVVRHRRCRCVRRRRLPQHRRPQQGADHLRWVQRVPPGSRGRVACVPRCRRLRSGRHAVGRVGRGRHRGGRRRRPVDAGRPARVRGRASSHPYKRPRAVRFVDELPRNALGKVFRHEL